MASASRQRSARSATSYTALLSAIALGALLRLWRLGSFPRLEADEGLWTTSTKNFLMFGDWFLDKRTHIVLSPLYHLLTLPLFATLGAHIASARLLSAIAGIAMIGIVFLIAERLRLGPAVPAVAAILCATNEWAVLVSRKALIESVEVCFLSLSVLLALRGGLRGAITAGLAFGLTLLTKTNAIAMTPIIALALAYASIAEESPERHAFVRAVKPVVVFGFVVALIAGLGYFTLYRLWPEEFRAAFLFVLDGRDQVPNAAPVVSVGRFGLEPRVIGGTVIALFRESPFLFVLATLGMALATARRSAGWYVLLAWAVIWMTFSFLQLFQPLRYFFLAFPALVLLAAGTVTALASGETEGVRRRVLMALSGMVAVFEISYIAANAQKNQEDRVAAVREWSRANLTGEETVLAASYLALDIPARALGYYYLVARPDSLTGAIAKYRVDYVLWDRMEWPAEYRTVLDRTYPRVAEWSFGAMYKTSGAP